MIENWRIAPRDYELLNEVVDRAIKELPRYPDSAATLLMDLNACHSNGCPLDFAGLLNADRYEFSHDIYGIRKAIDRNTGKLTEDCFMPRYALSNRVPLGG